MSETKEIDDFLCEQLLCDFVDSHNHPHQVKQEDEVEEKPKQEQQRQIQKDTQLSKQQCKRQLKNVVKERCKSNSKFGVRGGASVKSKIEKKTRNKRQVSKMNVDSNVSDTASSCSCISDNRWCSGEHCVNSVKSDGSCNTGSNLKLKGRKRRKVFQQEQKELEQELQVQNGEVLLSAAGAHKTETGVKSSIERNKQSGNVTTLTLNSTAGRILYITFDGFEGLSEYQMFPKKCTIFDVVNGGINTVFIKPSIPWDSLSDEEQQKFQFTEHYVLGYNWNDGEIEYDKFLHYLEKLSHQTRAIFTETFAWRDYLMNVLSRDVFLLSQAKKHLIEKKSHTTKQYDLSCMYTDHKRKWYCDGHDSKKYVCCQSRAYKDGKLLVDFFAKNSALKLMLCANTEPSSPEDINRPVLTI